MAVLVAEQTRAANTDGSLTSAASSSSSSLPPLPWTHALREALVFWLGTRCLYALITWAAALFGDVAVSQQTPAVGFHPINC